MDFYTGQHNVHHAKHHERVFVSVSRLWKRRSGFEVRDWIMDSAAFTQILKHGGYTEGVEVYVAEIKRWSKNGNLLAAVAQDYMCEPHMLAITGKTIEEHQQLTIERYDALLKCDTGGVYIIPVLQGYAPKDYVRHIEMHGDRLKPGMWVGVGSVCKRNGDPRAIERVLLTINEARPDLRLHGFGVKTTALSSPLVNELLHTADSMAWSFAARREGRNPNDWREARDWTERIETRSLQYSLFPAAV